MTERDSQPFRIQESVSTRAIDALMSNYRDPQQAFLELIDNAVDNRIEGKPLTVRIRVSKNELSVYNEGGRGLELDGLGKFFVWGYHQAATSTIGFYGVGGKAAMGYLGRSMEVVCSPQASEVEYRVSDPSWESREEGEWKEFTPEERRAQSNEGYFRVRVTNLKRDVNTNALVTKLGDIYRPLLLDNSVTISVNGRKVEALQIDYLEGDQNLAPQVAKIQTRFGDWIEVKIGVLADGQRVKPGIRCYYKGRLMEDEQFFGMPTPGQMPQMSRFIGEAHLDFVPVTTNKNSFDRGSVQWDGSVRAMRAVLDPWVKKMGELQIEQRNPIEAREKDIARRAKRVLEHVLAQTGLITKGMLPGESEGRRPPTPTGLPPRPRGGGGGSGGPKEGRTAPVLEATISEIKRWGAMYNWEVVSMGSLARRSEVVEENGKQVFKLNTDYPLYQAAKRAGDGALEIYVNETAIIKLAEIVTKGKSIEDYLELLDGLIRGLGAVYQRTIRGEQPTTTRSRGTIRFN